MKIYRFIGVSLLLLFAHAGVYSEELHIFAPFVSKLRTTVKDNTVKLTWADSKDISGTYTVYRSESIITETSFSAAVKAGTVPSGTEFFIDTLTETGSYYYAVIASENGKPYTIFIPFRNVSATAVSITVLSPRDIAVVVNNITAEVRNSSIVVSFSPSRTDRTAIVYRSTSPIRTSSDLVKATVLKTIESAERQYQDFPVPGVPYYYAVVDRGLVEYGAPVVTPGSNATSVAIIVPLSSESTAVLPKASYSSRSVPLPTLLISRSLETGKQFIPSDPMPEYVELSPGANKAVSALIIPGKSGPSLKTASVILPDDRSPGNSAEETTLFQILDTSFRQEKYAETVAILHNFLTMPHSIVVQKRARFYLGQAYFFLGKHENAILEFLAAREISYSDVNPWVDRTLLLLANR